MLALARPGADPARTHQNGTTSRSATARWASIKDLVDLGRYRAPRHSGGWRGGRRRTVLIARDIGSVVGWKSAQLAAFCQSEDCSMRRAAGSYGYPGWCCSRRCPPRVAGLMPNPFRTRRRVRILDSLDPGSSRGMPGWSKGPGPARRGPCWLIESGRAIRHHIKVVGPAVPAGHPPGMLTTEPDASIQADPGRHSRPYFPSREHGRARQS